jgi:hypothetical protein
MSGRSALPLLVPPVAAIWPPTAALTLQLQVQIEQNQKQLSAYIASLSVIRCEVKCGTELSCLRHRCPVVCCTAGAKAHVCDKMCTRKLDCGVHKCQEKCHPGLHALLCAGFVLHAPVAHTTSLLRLGGFVCVF